METVASVIRGAMEGDYNATESSTDHDHDDPALGLAERLRLMAISAPNSSRFLGKSSEGMLVRTAVELKSEYTGDSMFGNPQRSAMKNQRAEFWGVKSVR